METTHPGRAWKSLPRPFSCLRAPPTLPHLQHSHAHPGGTTPNHKYPQRLCLSDPTSLHLHPALTVSFFPCFFRETMRVRAPTPWFTPQTPTSTKAWSSQYQKLGAQSKPPTWVAGSQSLEPPRVCSSRRLESGARARNQSQASQCGIWMRDVGCGMRDLGCGSPSLSSH